MKNKFQNALAVVLGLGASVMPHFGVRQNNGGREPAPKKKLTQHDRDMLAKAQAKRDRKAGKLPEA